MSKAVLAYGVLFVLLGAGCAHKPATADATKASASAVDPGLTKDQPLSADVQGSDSGKIDGLTSVHFDYDSSSLSAETRGELKKDFDWIKSHPDSKLQIEGHCDRHGSVEYNFALGERRAKAVQTYLIQLGADAKRLSVISYGKERPLDNSETDAADRKNRRANFRPSGPNVHVSSN